MSREYKKIIIPGANHEGEPPEQRENVRWFRESERVVEKEDRYIHEQIYTVETKFSNGRTTQSKVKSVKTAHANGRQDVRIFVPTLGTRSVKPTLK